MACDVDNPLLGARGASAIFGPQKGATAQDVEFLDGALEHFARVAGHLDGPARVPGAGAAGGLGYAFVAFLGAKLQSGVDVVVDAVALADAVAGSDRSALRTNRPTRRKMEAAAPIIGLGVFFPRVQAELDTYDAEYYSVNPMSMDIPDDLELPIDSEDSREVNADELLGVSR